MKMVNENIKKCFDAAMELGWKIEHEDGNVFDFGKYSPAGQDFHISIDTENDVECFKNNLHEYCNGFDVSQETYLWLDSSGHGRNGAPYDMKDLYEDMEACLEMVEKLADKIDTLDL